MSTDVIDQIKAIDSKLVPSAHLAEFNVLLGHLNSGKTLEEAWLSTERDVWASKWDEQGGGDELVPLRSADRVNRIVPLIAIGAGFACGFGIGYGLTTAIKQAWN